MGQISVRLISAKQVPTALGALKRAGFCVEAVSERRSPFYDATFRCRHGDRQITISIYEDSARPGEAFVTVPYPPYTFLPWRWPGDQRLFNRLTGVFDEFEVEFRP